jgi:RNA polymerase sigma-70 factor (ECF subfamily)
MQIVSTIRDNSVLPVASKSGQELPAPASAQRRKEFEKIVSNELPRFRRIAMRWLRNPEDAEDAVQDAMLSAHKHIGGFSGRARLSTWITAIVINAVRMQLRRRPRYHIVSLDQTLEDGQVSISELIADPRPTPEQALERSELRALVTKVACGLPAAQRAALRLRQGDGLSIREAARRLGVPEGTLKAQLARGRTALTRRFQKAEGKRRTKAAIPDAKAKRTDGCAGNGPDSARCEVPMPIAGFQAQQGGYEAWVGA